MASELIRAETLTETVRKTGFGGARRPWVASGPPRPGARPVATGLVHHPGLARGWDEHPPADVSVGIGIQEELITALRGSSSWATSAYILTYDEHGGYFDHVAPSVLDAFGAGIRVPTG